MFRTSFLALIRLSNCALKVGTLKVLWKNPAVGAFNESVTINPTVFNVIRWVSGLLG